MNNILKRVKFIGDRIIDAKIKYPLRQKRWSKNTLDVFQHRTSRGHIFFLHSREYIDKFIFIEDIYEKRFLDNLCRRFNPGAVALDVGANIGNHAIYLSEEFAEIHCFEPNPETFRRLGENVRANGIENIKLHQAGLGDRDAVLPFSENLEGNLGNSGFVKNAGACGGRITSIPVFQADKYIQDLGISRVDFIKIDVEGFEPHVFNGLRATIKTHRPVIAFEFHGHLAEREDFAKIAECMPGYAFYELMHAPASASILEKLRWNLRHGGRAVLRRFAQPEARTYENILAFSSEGAARAFEDRK